MVIFRLFLYVYRNVLLRDFCFEKQVKREQQGSIPKNVKRVASNSGNRFFKKKNCQWFSCSEDAVAVKAGDRLKPVFPPRNLGLMQISRSRFKHSQNPLFVPQSYV